MKHRTGLVLLATLASAGAWGQDVGAFSTTMLQYAKQDTPGFAKTTLAPLTEFLGVDATRLGSDALSLHLYGWGAKDLADQSLPRSKADGDLSYAYLEYRFKQANAQLKAGRFAASQSTGVEQVDGVSARTDLKNGFNLSAFAGRPVRYRAQQDSQQTGYNLQHDFIFGSRLGLLLGKVGEAGVSYLQDGSKGMGSYPNATVSYERRQLGADLRLAPVAQLEINGHSVFDVGSQFQPAGSTTGTPSRVAEHDYVVSYRFTPQVALNATYAQHDLQAYFAGTNLPNLFRADEKDKHKAMGGALVLNTFGPVEVTVDFKHTKRDTFGNTNRFGADARWAVAEAKVKAGGGLHRVSASDAAIDPAAGAPLYGMSRTEARAWVMYEAGKYNASLDGILYHFDDSANPYLNGKGSLAQMVASAGVRPTENLSVSGDLTYGTNPQYKYETSVLLRTTYKFAASKGGK
jgi:hypothetical protein